MTNLIIISIDKAANASNTYKCKVKISKDTNRI